MAAKRKAGPRHTGYGDVDCGGWGRRLRSPRHLLEGPRITVPLPHRPFTLSLVTRVGPGGNRAHDSAVWREPRILLGDGLIDPARLPDDGQRAAYCRAYPCEAATR